MLYWASVFLVIALIAGGVGFGLATAGTAVIAKALCLMFVGLAVLSMVTVLARPRALRE